MPPLNINVLPLTTSTYEPETIVAPRITLVVPPTVSISAPAPVVVSLPPDSVAPPRSSVTALTAALTAKVPELAMAPLRVSSPPSVTSMTEPETIVALLITLWLPLPFRPRRRSPSATGRRKWSRRRD